jgi:hypothetical protein
VPPRRWLQFVNDIGRFLDGGFAMQAAALGWGPFELFGCDLTGHLLGSTKPGCSGNSMGIGWLLLHPMPH